MNRAYLGYWAGATDRLCRSCTYQELGVSSDYWLLESRVLVSSSSQYGSVTAAQADHDVRPYGLLMAKGI